MKTIKNSNLGVFTQFLSINLLVILTCLHPKTAQAKCQFYTDHHTNQLPDGLVQLMNSSGIEITVGTEFKLTYSEHTPDRTQEMCHIPEIAWRVSKLTVTNKIGERVKTITARTTVIGHPCTLIDEKLETTEMSRFESLIKKLKNWCEEV